MISLGGFGRRTGALVGRGDPSPIRLEGGNPPVLAFHGFTSTPAEVRLLAGVAERAGLGFSAPLLPGHGKSARDLQRTTWEDWTRAAEHALEAIAPPNQQVILTGQSMGGLLAAHLAATHPDRAAALVVLGIATNLPFFATTLPLRLIALSRLDRRDLYVWKRGSDIRDEAARAEHLTYDVDPVRAAVQLLRAGRIVRGELERITCPTLILHGLLDRVCPASNAWEMAAKVGTSDTEVALFARSAHVLTLDVDRDKVADRIDVFVRKVAARSGTASGQRPEAASA